MDDVIDKGFDGRKAKVSENEGMKGWVKQSVATLVHLSLNRMAYVKYLKILQLLEYNL